MGQLNRARKTYSEGKSKAMKPQAFGKPAKNIPFYLVFRIYLPIKETETSKNNSSQAGTVNIRSKPTKHQAFENETFQSS